MTKAAIISNDCDGNGYCSSDEYDPKIDEESSTSASKSSNTPQKVVKTFLHKRQRALQHSAQQQEQQQNQQQNYFKSADYCANTLPKSKLGRKIKRRNNYNNDIEKSSTQLSFLHRTTSTSSLGSAASSTASSSGIDTLTSENGGSSGDNSGKRANRMNTRLKRISYVVHHSPPASESPTHFSTRSTTPSTGFEEEDGNNGSVESGERPKLMSNNRIFPLHERTTCIPKLFDSLAVNQTTEPLVPRNEYCNCSYCTDCTNSTDYTFPKVAVNSEHNDNYTFEISNSICDNLPNDLQTFFEEQKKYYRKIYDEQFAALGRMKLEEVAASIVQNASEFNRSSTDSTISIFQQATSSIQKPTIQPSRDYYSKNNHRFAAPKSKTSSRRNSDRKNSTASNTTECKQSVSLKVAQQNRTNSQRSTQSAEEKSQQHKEDSIAPKRILRQDKNSKKNKNKLLYQPIQLMQMPYLLYVPYSTKAATNYMVESKLRRKNDSLKVDDVYEISRMDVLSEQIMEFHESVEQTQETLNLKLNLRDMLYYTIAPIFPMCGLYIIGSSLNGFGNNKSDMDLCLMITNRDIDQRTDAVTVLSSISRTIENTKLVADQQLILAKVPILRIKFHGAYSNITVDLNVNNSVAIRNTHLLCYYSSFDWRVRPLVAVVKEWAKRRGINDANRSSFTSYSLVLMVIHYLQCGANPPVLPSLQQLYPKRFHQKADVRSLNVAIPLDPNPSTIWDFNDRLTLSELLIGFLQYYAFNFNFDADAISIRLGKKTERAFVARNRSPYNHLSQWHCICIEEPFTFSNTAHSVYDERIFDSIKKAFVDSFHELDTNRDLDTFLGPALYSAATFHGPVTVTTTMAMILTPPATVKVTSNSENNEEECK